MEFSVGRMFLHCHIWCLHKDFWPSCLFSSIRHLSFPLSNKLFITMKFKHYNGKINNHPNYVIHIHFSCLKSHLFIKRQHIPGCEKYSIQVLFLLYNEMSILKYAQYIASNNYTKELKKGIRKHHMRKCPLITHRIWQHSITSIRAKYNHQICYIIIP